MAVTEPTVYGCTYVYREGDGTKDFRERNALRELGEVLAGAICPEGLFQIDVRRKEDPYTDFPPYRQTGVGEDFLSSDKYREVRYRVTVTPVRNPMQERSDLARPW